MRAAWLLGCVGVGLTLGAPFARAAPIALTNGGFEQIADGFPTDWGAFTPDFGPDTQAEIGPSSDAHSGRHSLRLAVTGRAQASGLEVAGVNRSYPRDVHPAGRLEVRRGGFTFWYKYVRAGGGRPAVQVIPMGRSDIEDTGSPRITFDLPPEYAGDGQWHEGFLKFDFTDNDKVAWIQPVFRIFDGPAEFLVDDIAYLERLGPRLTIARLVIAEDENQPGERGTLRATIENTGDQTAAGIAVQAALPDGLRSDSAAPRIETLEPDAKAESGFVIVGRRDRQSEIGVTATCDACPPASRTLRIAPALEIASFHASPFVMEEHGESQLALRLSNPGNAITTGVGIDVKAPTPLRLAAADLICGNIEIPPGQSFTRRWRLTASRQSPLTYLHARITAAQGLRAFKAARLIVWADRPLVPDDAGGRGHYYLEDGAGRPAFVIGNEQIRIIFPEAGWPHRQSVMGVGYLQVRSGDGWRDAGIMPSLGRVVYLSHEGRREEAAFYLSDRNQVRVFSEVRSPIWGSRHGLEFPATHLDAAGGLWRAVVSFAVEEHRERIRITSSLTCKQSRDVLAFEGPMIYWGEGAFGAEKTDAIFPGLEWLVNGEESSSTLDDISPAHLRYVPHPNKVTIPRITLSHDGTYMGIEWEMRRGCGPYTLCRHPQGVVFASPNRFEDTASHLMGAFVPSVPDWVDENQRQAKKPYPLQVGKTLRVRFALFAGEGDALGGQAFRYERYGIRGPLAAPRGTAQKELAFSMAAYTDSLYIPDEDTWWTSKGAGPLLSPKGLPAFFVDDVWLASTALQDPALKRKYRGLAQKMLDRLSLPAAGYPLAFRVGGLDHAMLGLAGQVQGLIAAQRDDGSWRFDADKIDTGVFKGYDYHDLGPDDAAEVGTCAWNAYQVLRFARMTGDAKARDAGLKALKFMDQFRVPRAAQVWEVPVHTPDLLAASDAIEAYLEGYQITGDKRYLERAVYWGKAGLPFVYVWNAPNRNFMRSASIPVFGASWLKWSWFGRPVQWNGLRYGYALQKLARHDDTLDWARLAHGVMVSAMYQQAEEGEDKALWPDSIGAIRADKSPWVFAPYQINKMLYTEMGLDPEPQTTVVQMDGGAVRLSSVARITSARSEGDRLQAALEYPAGETTHLLVCGVSKPSRVSLAGRALASVERLDVSSGTGWWYDSARAALIVRVRHSGRDTLLIEGVSAVEAQFLPEIAHAIAFEFDRPGDIEGWLPAHDIADMAAADGVLRLAVTGGDPYLVRSGLRVPADSVREVVVRMKTTAGEQAQFFWATDLSPGIDEPKSLHFAVVPDGTFHDYRIPVGDHPQWKGTITEIRLDPNQSQPGSRVEVDFIRGE